MKQDHDQEIHQAVPVDLPEQAQDESPSEQIAVQSPVVADAMPDDRGEVAQRVMQAFTGPIELVEASLLYRLGIVLTSFVMLILILFYPGLVVLVIVLTFHSAVAGFFLLAPLSAILGFFMLKLLFFRPVKEQEPRELLREHEPLLFEFVNRVCETVQAPRPCVIQVDNQANASASFRHGARSLLFGKNDLVLTIGLPLIAGLNMQQFAGVLAHEFGHFSQGAGMRLIYLCRAISQWFTRVVHDRDRLDEYLVRTAHASPLRFAVFAIALLALIWLNRQILWCLMMIGNLVTGFMLRQMELDADRYEARLAGSETFGETQWLFNVLQVSRSRAFGDLKEFQRDGKLPDNLPQLIEANVHKLPAELLQELHTAVSESKTLLFDKYPCDRERILNANLENSAGVFHLQLPAKQLFTDFDGLARLVTSELYQQFFGETFEPRRVHATAGLIVRQGQDTDNQKCLQRFSLCQFGGLGSIALPYWQLQRSIPPAPERTLETLRQRAVETVPQFVQYFNGFQDTRTQLCQQELSVSMNRAGFGDLNAMVTLQADMAQGIIKIQALWEAMNPFRRTLGERLIIDLELLQDKTILEATGENTQVIQEVNCLLAVANHLRQSHTAFERLFVNCHKLEILLTSVNPEGTLTEEHYNEIEFVMNQLYAEICSIRERLCQAAYPFDHSKGNISVSSFLVAEYVPDDNSGAIFEAATNMLDNAEHLNVRIFARLAVLAEKVERALGLEPLVDFEAKIA